MIRLPSAAGSFYPDSKAVLLQNLKCLEEQASHRFCLPDVVISPHAGYCFSGAVAASAFQCFRGQGSSVDRVVIIGTSHFASLDEATTIDTISAFQTPLGNVKVDHDYVNLLCNLVPLSLKKNDRVHQAEYSIEVQLPFLQHYLTDFSIVPVLAASTSGDDLSRLLCFLAEEKRTLVVVSSDLTHGLSKRETFEKLQEILDQIETLNTLEIDEYHTCCKPGVVAAINSLRRVGGEIECVELLQSMDVRDQLQSSVGYGAFHAFYDQ